MRYNYFMAGTLYTYNLTDWNTEKREPVSQGDIISVALTPKWHRGVANSIATPENIWKAHKTVYEGIGHNDWANAIYEAYVKPLGISY